MPRPLRWCFVLFIVALLVGVPIAYALYHQRQFRSFRIVREGVLYRSGQLPLSGLKRVIHDFGIRTVVSLRDSYTPGEVPPDLAEEAYCKKEEINYYRLSPAAWEAEEGPPPVEKNVRKFRAIVADPKNYPILVHCCAGIHRTGAYVAIYRMEREHWTNAQAIAEMKACGYANLDDEWDILGYLERYRPLWQTGAAEVPAEHAKGPHRHTAKKHAHKVKKPKERKEPRADDGTGPLGPERVHGGISP